MKLDVSNRRERKIRVCVYVWWGAINTPTGRGSEEITSDIHYKALSGMKTTYKTYKMQESVRGRFIAVTIRGGGSNQITPRRTRESSSAGRAGGEMRMEAVTRKATSTSF